MREHPSPDAGPPRADDDSGAGSDTHPSQDSAPSESLGDRLAAIQPPPPRDFGAQQVRRSVYRRIFGGDEPLDALGGYTVVGRLGQGGMGVVHEGRSRSGRPVALKTLRDPSTADVLRLKHEFRCAADLGHPNLVAVYELAQDPARGEWFIAMEYVPGARWSDHVRPGGAAVPAEVLRDALIQLARGVHALHRAGLLHRDLKPSNVLVTAEGRVKILDFGLARGALDGAEPREGQIAGTPGYIPPEQARGAAASPAGDWYAVGVMLHEALTGRRPGAAPRPVAALAPGAPADLAALCDELLAPRPEDRPPGREILRRLGHDPGPGAEAPSALIGRARELSACAAALDEAAAGRPAIALLVGSSGAGKSALLARFLAQARRERDALVLAGRCYEGESVPYKALDGSIDALARHLLDCTSEHVEKFLPEETHALARVFPALARVPAIAARAGQGEAPADPRETRRRAVVALRRLLAGLAAERLVVLAVDDLQWGDADSARLLAELLAPPDAPALLGLATVRSDLRAGSTFFAELATAQLGAAVREISVDPLAHDDALALASALLGAEPGDHAAALAAAIARESQGSPLFVEAMARRAAVGELATEGLGGATLDRTLLAEVHDLEPAARRALELIAVAGRPISGDLVLAAADTRAGDGAPLALLRALRLVRGGGDGEAVESYHDRVRSVVLRHLGRDVLRAHHLRLAESLGRAPRVDPEQLALHFHGAGELARAGAWAARAAERAAQALAFVQAAELYAQALSWGTWPSGQVLEFSLARADALTHAGHCAEAAPAYLTAAALAPDPLRSLALRGRAAEQYLVSGRVDAGLRVLRPAVRELGLPFPATALGTLARLLAELGRLAVRGDHFDERPADAIAAREGLRLDLCWAASKGLGFIDPVRGAVFAAYGMRLALECGEPTRIARATAFLSMLDINAGDPRLAERGARQLDLARGLAERTGDPHLIGFTTVLSGVAAMNNGRWRRAVAEVEAGAAYLRDRCVGVTWERGIAHAMAMHSLYMLGEFPELERRADAWRREADDTGDRFAGVCAALYAAHVALAADAPGRAREAVRKALSLWTYDRFSFQHWLALEVEVACDLYEDRPEDAWARVRRAWPGLRRAQLMRMQIPRIDVHLLRGTAALAAARRAEPRARPGLLRSAAADADRLARERIDFARAGSELLRAQLAALEGRPADAALRAAADRFADGDMPALAAAVRRSRGDERADAALERCGVRDPARWARVVAPVAADRS